MTTTPIDLHATLLDNVDPAPLFTPFDLGGVTLRNRFVMAPMTRRHSPDGVPGDDVVEYYAKRARHLGLIVTEGTYVDHPSAGRSESVPRFYGTESLAGWRKVIEAVHAEGSAIFPQLWHIGVQRPAGTGPVPDAPVLSPSGIDIFGEAAGDGATQADIDAVIEAFAQGAVDAKAAGFDGVELHGAHGYLLDQFHWEATNQRIDLYGGSIPARTRLSVQIVEEIRHRLGSDYPISFRFSQWKAGNFGARLAHNPDELDAFLSPLVTAGVSVLHASSRRYWLPEFEGSDRTLAGWTKHLSGLPTITVGSVGVAAAFFGDKEAAQASLSLAPLVERFEAGEFDLVGLGRSVLSDPEWTDKVREGRLNEIRGYEKEHEARLD